MMESSAVVTVVISTGQCVWRLQTSQHGEGMGMMLGYSNFLGITWRHVLEFRRDAWSNPSWLCLCPPRAGMCGNEWKHWLHPVSKHKNHVFQQMVHLCRAHHGIHRLGTIRSHQAAASFQMESWKDLCSRRCQFVCHEVLWHSLVTVLGHIQSLRDDVAEKAQYPFKVKQERKWGKETMKQTNLWAWTKTTW